LNKLKAKVITWFKGKLPRCVVQHEKMVCGACGQKLSVPTEGEGDKLKLLPPGQKGGCGNQMRCTTSQSRCMSMGALPPTRSGASEVKITKCKVLMLQWIRNKWVGTDNELPLGVDEKVENVSKLKNVLKEMDALGMAVEVLHVKSGKSGNLHWGGEKLKCRNMYWIDSSKPEPQHIKENMVKSWRIVIKELRIHPHAKVAEVSNSGASTLRVLTGVVMNSTKKKITSKESEWRKCEDPEVIIKENTIDGKKIKTIEIKGAPTCESGYAWEVQVVAACDKTYRGLVSPYFRCGEPKCHGVVHNTLIGEKDEECLKSEVAEKEKCFKSEVAEEENVDEEEGMERQISGFGDRRTTMELLADIDSIYAK